MAVAVARLKPVADGSDGGLGTCELRVGYDDGTQCRDTLVIS